MSWMTSGFSSTVTAPTAWLLACGGGAAFGCGDWIGGVAALGCGVSAGMGGVAALGCGDWVGMGGVAALEDSTGSTKVTRAGAADGSDLQLDLLKAEALTCKLLGSSFSVLFMFACCDGVGTMPVVAVVSVASDSAGASWGDVGVASLGVVLFEPADSGSCCADSLGSCCDSLGAETGGVGASGDVTGACLGTVGCGCSAGDTAGFGAAALGGGGDFKDMLVRCLNRKIGCLATSSCNISCLIATDLAAVHTLGGLLFFCTLSLATTGAATSGARLDGLGGGGCSLGFAIADAIDSLVVDRENTAGDIFLSMLSTHAYMQHIWYARFRKTWDISL